MDLPFPSRQIYWNIPYHLLLYFFLLIALAIFMYGTRQRYLKWRSGQPEKRFDQVFKRAGLVLREVALHRRLLRYPYAGSFHYLVVVGFFVLFMGTVVVFLESDLGIPLMSGRFYLYFQSLTLDIAGALALIGIILAGFHRFVLKPDRYQGMKSGWIELALLFLVLTSGFVVEGLRISATGDPWKQWSPIGLTTSYMFAHWDIETQKTLHRIVWWLHMALAFGLLAYLPFSKLRHLLLGPLNIYFQRLSPKGVIVDPIDIETAEKLGTEFISDFSWKHLLDLDVCTECGRCQEMCPVWGSGQESLSPRSVILALRDAADREAPVVELVGKQTIWLCRTCRACMEECPVAIEHIPKLIEMRRFEIMESVDFPKTLHDPMESLEARGHPYRGTRASRVDWFAKLDIPLAKEGEEVDFLYWVGCTTSLNEDNWAIAQNLAELFKQAGVSFAVLGEEEMCCGEPARRVGNEYLFENIARQNIEILNNYKFKAIVTGCPHCYNMLKNEYRDFQGFYEVCHHSEVLQRLINNGQLTIKAPLECKLTYHDPCYLGRYNDIYETPRSLIHAVCAGKMVEMKRTKSRSFCCGGGGGGAWLGEEGVAVENRVNVNRARQATETGAEILVTACPFCMMMLRDGTRSLNREDVPEVMDIANLLYSAIKKEKP